MYIKKDAYSNLSVEEKQAGLVGLFSVIEFLAMALEFISGSAYLVIFVNTIEQIGLFSKIILAIVLIFMMLAIIGVQSAAFNQAFSDLFIQSKYPHLFSGKKKLVRGLFWSVICAIITIMFIFLNKEGDHMILKQYNGYKPTTGKISDNSDYNETKSQIASLDSSISALDKKIQRYKCVGCGIVDAKYKSQLKDESKYTKSVDIRFARAQNKKIYEQMDLEKAAIKSKELELLQSQRQSLVEQSRSVGNMVSTIIQSHKDGTEADLNGKKKQDSTNTMLAGYLAYLTQFFLYLARMTMLNLRAKEGKVFLQRGLMYSIYQFTDGLSKWHERRTFVSKEKSRIRRAASIVSSIKRIDDYIDENANSSDIREVLDRKITSIEEAYSMLRAARPIEEEIAASSKPSAAKADDIKRIIEGYEEALLLADTDEEKQTIFNIIQSYKEILADYE